jgi:hypothetical protein
MQRLTTTGRILLTLVIFGVLYGGYRLVGGKEALQKLTPQNTVASETMPGSQPSGTEASSEGSTEASDVASDTRMPAFDYSPPAVVNGTLKGVVELGASGFNSFIVKIDKSKNWQLEKAEFGNSLVTENMATDEDIRIGLKKYIGHMLDFGVSGRDIHFVVSSGAVKADVTQKIVKALKSLNYFVNTVTPEAEGSLGHRVVVPEKFVGQAFMVDIGSGNTKISWKKDGQLQSLETYGSKYFQNNTSDEVVANDVAAKAKQIPADNRKVCFIIGGVPFDLAKTHRNGKERFTLLKAPQGYQVEKAKEKAGLNIYKSIAQTTGCEQFVFDFDANFTIGFLLNLP